MTRVINVDGFGQSDMHRYCQYQIRFTSESSTVNLKNIRWNSFKFKGHSNHASVYRSV